MPSPFPSSPADRASDVLAIIDADGARFADPDAAQLTVLELAATRGDGIFETFGCHSGHPQAVDAHLARFARSARALDLPAPDLAAWRAAVLAVGSQLSPFGEATIKTVYSRGREGTPTPTGWVHGRAAPDFTRSRVEGIRVITLDRGYRHDIAQTAPWLLAGAKTLSYAVNTAALREATRRGADDAIFVSSDGIVLEGPTSNVLVRRGSRLVTPELTLPVLAGTTQAAAFDFAESRGLETSFESFTTDALQGSDGVWLVSSVRLAAPVVAIDDLPVPLDTEFTAALNLFLQSRTI